MNSEIAPFIAEMKCFVAKCGSQKAAAKSLKITPAYLCDILKGSKPISERIARKLGFRWKLERVADDAA